MAEEGEGCFSGTYGFHLSLTSGKVSLQARGKNSAIVEKRLYSMILCLLSPAFTLLSTLCCLSFWNSLTHVKSELAGCYSNLGLKGRMWFSFLSYRVDDPMFLKVCKYQKDTLIYTEEIQQAYTCVKGEQVWREFLPLLARVILDTWKKLVAQWELMAASAFSLSTHFHALQFCIFLFTSMAHAAEERINGI